MSENPIRKREDQRVEDTWKLEDLFESVSAWEEACVDLKKEIDAFAGFEGTLQESPERLSEALLAYSSMNLLLERIYVYANQKYHEDTANGESQALSGKAEKLAVLLGERTSFLEPEILSVSDEKMNTWIGLSGMGEWKRFLELILRDKAHTLTAKEEALLSRVKELGAAGSNIYSMFNNADVRFRSIPGEGEEELAVTAGRFVGLLRNRNREIRKEAFASVYETYEQFRNTLAAAFDANAKKTAFFAKERHFSSARAMALNSSAVPEEVYDQLIDCVHERMDLMYRYISIRKKMLGLEELHFYDIYVPMVDVVEKVYSFEEAKHIVAEALKPLGEAYGRVLQEGFKDRWIDVYENEGKRTGAYSWGAYGTHPYVLLNYQGNLNDVFTLAHEMGHALHSWHSDKAQNYLNAGYHIFVAEVASTCNEALLIRYMLEHTTDRKEKAYLINYFLEQFKSTLYRQTMFAEFERDVHALAGEGEPLTAQLLCDRYYELNRKYFGSEMVIDPQIRYEWERIPHFYTPFYVYQYATGFSAAMALSSRILAGEEGAVEKYIGFLSGGGSKDPIDLLKDCGVDMTSKTPVMQALDVFEQYLDEMEALIKE